MTVRVAAMPHDYPRRGVLRRADTALLVIDMQHDFCSPGGYWEAIGGNVAVLRAAVAPCRRVLEAARRAGLHVVHTRVGRRADVIDAAPEGRHAQPEGGGRPGPLGRHLVRGEPGWQIVDELTPLAGETVIDKPATGAFHATDLDHVLRAMGIANLVMCGVTTAICVGTTVREAHDRGYDVLVLGDACAEADPAMHQAALAMVTLEGGLFGAVAGVEAFASALRDLA